MYTNNFRNVYRNNSQLQREWAYEDDKNKPKMPPEHVLDEIAEQKLTGGYNTEKSNLCNSCYTYRSANGSCMCD